MRKITVAFHSPNKQLKNTLERFAKGLDFRKHYFQEGISCKDTATNFFVGSLVGSGEEILLGIEALESAQANLRVWGKKVPMAVITDPRGHAAWQRAKLDRSSVRLAIRIGETSKFPDVKSLVCEGARRVDVRTLDWTEEELARVRVGLMGATSPFSWGGM